MENGAYIKTNNPLRDYYRDPREVIRKPDPTLAQTVGWPIPFNLADISKMLMIPTARSTRYTSVPGARDVPLIRLDLLRYCNDYDMASIFTRKEMSSAELKRLYQGELPGMYRLLPEYLPDRRKVHKRDDIATLSQVMTHTTLDLAAWNPGAWKRFGISKPPRAGDRQSWLVMPMGTQDRTALTERLREAHVRLGQRVVKAPWSGHYGIAGEKIMAGYPLMFRKEILHLMIYPDVPEKYRAAVESDDWSNVVEAMDDLGLYASDAYYYLHPEWVRSHL